MTTYSVIVYILMVVSPNGTTTQHRYTDYTSCNRMKTQAVELARKAGTQSQAECVPQQEVRERKPQEQHHHKASSQDDSS